MPVQAPPGSSSVLKRGRPGRSGVTGRPQAAPDSDCWAVTKTKAGKLCTGLFGAGMAQPYLDSQVAALQQCIPAIFKSNGSSDGDPASRRSRLYALEVAALEREQEQQQRYRAVFIPVDPHLGREINCEILNTDIRNYPWKETPFGDVYYSPRYDDERYTYRHVILSRGVRKEAEKLAATMPGGLLTEDMFIHCLGIALSPGWTHFMCFHHKLKELILRRPKEQENARGRRRPHVDGAPGDGDEVLVDSDDEQPGSSSLCKSGNCQPWPHEKIVDGEGPTEPWQESTRAGPVKHCDGATVSGNAHRGGVERSYFSQTSTRCDIAPKSRQQDSAERGFGQAGHEELGVRQTIDQVPEGSADIGDDSALQTCETGRLCRAGVNGVSSAVCGSSRQTCDAPDSTLGQTDNHLTGDETGEQSGGGVNERRRTELFGVQKRCREAHAGNGDREEQPKVKHNKIHNCDS